jgi:molecular chaperone GrpE
MRDNMGNIEEKEEKGSDDRKAKENEESHEEHKKRKKKDEVIEELEKAVARKEEESKTLQDKLLYLQADFENFKKIKAKEKQDAIKFGNEALILDLLPVLDSLQMALEHATKTEDFKGIHEGVKLTLNQFLKVLEKAGVVAVDAVGKKFDPNLHEAFYQEERADTEPATVLSEFQKGYLLNDRLIRPSRVIVSKEPEVQ